MPPRTKNMICPPEKIRSRGCFFVFSLVLGILLLSVLFYGDGNNHSVEIKNTPFIIADATSNGYVTLPQSSSVDSQERFKVIPSVSLSHSLAPLQPPLPPPPSKLSPHPHHHPPPPPPAPPAPPPPPPLVKNTCVDKPESTPSRGALDITTDLTIRFKCAEGYFGTEPSEEWKCSQISPRGEWKWIFTRGSGCARPLMQDNEIDLLTRAYANAKRVFEFGSGGSTRVASSLPMLDLLVSVESDPSWALTSDLSNRNVSFVHEMRLIDLDAKPGDFGNPGRGATKENMSKYASQLLLHTVTDFDVVLVDGRFRVACAFSFILKELPASSRLVIHDYFDRSHYHVVEKYLTEIERAGTSIVFQRRIDLSDLELQEVKEGFEQYKSDAR